MGDPRLKGKHWSKEFEKPLYEKWKKENIYAFDKKSKRKIYSIDTPPPYVNTPVHIGQATTYVLMDFFARFRRMIGRNVLFPLGLDRNGLPIEMAAEKKFNVKLTSLPRKKAIEYCEKILEESSLASTETFLKSGISFNSWKLGNEPGDVYHTDSPEYRSLTQETFIDMWNKGLIYEDDRANNWCPGCQTTIADAEIEYKDLSAFFNDVKFKIKETGEEIIIATTRPELICTCGMVIFNPKDKRYKHLDGKTAITPIYEKEVPIKAHPAAEMEKGTGIMMMCSFGDVTDIRFFREQGLEPVIAINKDGTMNKHAGFLKGINAREAQKKIVMELYNKGLLVKQKKLVHRTPVCERSKDSIEFINMKEFYVKQVKFKDKMRELTKKMNFYAPRSRQIMLDWIDSVNIDWPVSRRRYYATEIPLWYDVRNDYTVLPPKGKYYRPWKERPPQDSVVFDKKKKKIGLVKEFPKSDWVGETRVFDTWFDSSITPLYILRYSRDEAFFKRAHPCSLRPQGKEIIRTWLYYTVLKDYLLTRKLIFEDAWINYHIVDEKGHKMSKSRENVIDPQDVINKFGAEPFRLWSAVEGNLDRTDFRCSFDRIKGAVKTLTKLWNVARFISMFPKPKGKYELLEVDKWIIHEVNKLVKLARKKYEVYDFHNPAIKIKHLIWEDFASHYLELVKSRAYNQDNAFSKEEQNGALFTLNYCLDTILKLLAPLVPFITYRIYKDLRNKDVHFESFPEVEHDYKPKFSTDDVVSVNGAIWKYKKDKNMSLRDGLKEVTLPEKVKSLEKDLKAMHNIKNVKYGKKVKIS
ncbi:MAG: valine--tRNA ligase [Nanoarchaeota archaeon]|nr:valine--tRNA ligase [DPANN group archaeon]MBL7116347.1 valine--tRNA ligase [Nanoarchaeota archaeon]